MGIFDDDAFAVTGGGGEVESRLFGGAEAAELAISDPDAPRLTGKRGANLPRVGIDAAPLFRRAINFKNVVAGENEILADAEHLPRF